MHDVRKRDVVGKESRHLPSAVQLRWSFYIMVTHLKTLGQDDYIGTAACSGQIISTQCLPADIDIG